MPLDNIASSLPFSLTPQVLWVVFALFTSVVIIMTLILLYHWSKYGYNGFYIGIATTVYAVGIFILFSSTFISFAAYIQSL